MDFTNKQKIISLVLKALVIVSVIVGVFQSWYAGRNAFMGGSSVFMYFTIQSNIAVGIIALIGLVLLLRKTIITQTWYLIKFVGTVSITLTGIVFCFVLAPTMGNAAWNVQNILTHVIVPVAFVVDFFVTSNQSELKKSSVLYVILPPLVYAIYAGIGYVCNWQFAPGYNYPYFFLNWGSPAGALKFTSEFPFMGCLWWIFVLLIFLIAVAYGYLKIVDLIKKQKNK